MAKGIVYKYLSCREISVSLRLLRLFLCCVTYTFCAIKYKTHVVGKSKVSWFSDPLMRWSHVPNTFSSTLINLPTTNELLVMNKFAIMLQQGKKSSLLSLLRRSYFISTKLKIKISWAI